jgi:PAS domain S-box-containing protein
MMPSSTAESRPSAHPEPIRAVRSLHSIFARCLYAFIFAAIVGTGLYGSWRAAADADARIRLQLLRQAREIARTIDPELARSLSFSSGHSDFPVEKRLRDQLQDYCAVLKPRGIYTLARRGDALVFGVESYLPDDPLSSAQGTRYLLPPAEVRAVFERKRPDAVFGPVTDEYGSFVTALAPVIDPRTGDTILAVGVDLMAADWASSVRASSHPPLWLAGAAVLLFGTGLALRNRHRKGPERTPVVLRTEPLFAAWIGLLLTLLTTGLLLETERHTRESNFDSHASAMQTRLSQAIRHAAMKLREAEAYGRSRVGPITEEFAPLLDPMTPDTSLRFFAWIPETHLPEPAAGPGTLTSPPGLRPYVWPASETTFVLNSGLGDPELSILFDQARGVNDFCVSPPRPIPERPEIRGLLYLSRYLPPPHPGTDAWTRPGGWLVIGLEPGRVFQDTTRSEFSAEESACLCLMDITHSLEAPVPILAPSPRSDECDCLNSFSLRVFRDRSLARMSPLFLFNRTYVIASHPTPHFLRTQSLRATQVAGIAGLIFTCLLTLLVILLRHRQSDLERGIRERIAEIQEREENLSVTLHSIGDGVLVTDVEDRIIRMNPAAERWTEWPQAEAMGQPLTRVYRLDRSASDALDPDPPEHRAPTHLLARSGRSLPVSDSVAPIRNSSGVQIGRIVVFRDITELFAAQKALENSERQYQLLFDGLASGFSLYEILMNSDGEPVDCRFLKINSVFEKLLGLEAKDIVGRTVLELFPETEPYWIASLSRVALTGQPVHLEHMNSALNRFLEVDAYCPKAGQVATLVTDITERRRLEEDRSRLERSLQQKQRLESLGVLAGGIAHDFNNILMVILGNTELLRQTLPDSSPAGPPIRDIATAARTAADLCRQMLAYAGRGRYVIEPLDLNRVVTEMEPILKTIVSKGGRILYRLAPSIPAIEGDASQLRQIILNLTLNASEALGDGQGTITISSGALLCTTRFLRDLTHHSDLPEGLYVFLEVSDTGSGMTPDVLARIFDPFFTTKFTGRGLGLAAVLGIVHSHRGGLSVTSEPGVGTTFKAFFPVLGEPPRTPARAGSNLKRKPQWMDRKTVLLADPDRSVRDVGRHLLEELGVQAITAGSGPEALDLFRRHSAELSCALLDLHLNEKDGENLAQALRKIRPDLPILFSGIEDLRQAPPGCTPGGRYGYLRKPYDINSLVDSLNPLLVQPPPYKQDKLEGRTGES